MCEKYSCFSPPPMYIPCFLLKFVVFKMLPTIWKFPKERKRVRSTLKYCKLSTLALPVVFLFFALYWIVTKLNPFHSLEQ